MSRNIPREIAVPASPLADLTCLGLVFVGVTLVPVLGIAFQMLLG